jgi:hypothetical protein
VFLWLWLIKNSRGSTLATLESATPTSGARGVLIPLTRKLAIRTLARAVRPAASGQFEKLAVGLPGAVRPPPLGPLDRPGQREPKNPSLFSQALQHVLKWQRMG